MAKELSIAIEIAESRIAEALTQIIKSMPEVRLSRWHDSIGEKGPLATKISPDIIIVDDDPESSAVFKRIRKFKEHYPNADIFVVSSDKQPQHIVEVIKAGANEYLVEPINKKVLEDSINETRVKLANSGKIAKGSIYSFISSKGGSGASVISVNLAAELAHKKEESVVLSDMSFQSGDSSVLLDLIPENSFADICKNFHRFDIAFLRGCLLKHKSGLDFLAAPINPEECEDIHPEHILKTLEYLRKLYDYAIVDCTSMFVDDCTVEAIHVSKKVFIITDLSVPAIRNAARLFQTFKKLGVHENQVEFIVNRFIKGGTLSLDEIEKTLGKRIFWLFPNDFSDIVTSINRGTPLTTYNPEAPFSRSIHEFAMKLKNPDKKDQYRGVKGAFGKTI